MRGHVTHHVAVCCHVMGDAPCRCVVPPQHPSSQPTATPTTLAVSYSHSQTHYPSAVIQPLLLYSRILTSPIPYCCHIATSSSNITLPRPALYTAVRPPPEPYAAATYFQRHSQRAAVSHHPCVCARACPLCAVCCAWRRPHSVMETQMGRGEARPPDWPTG